MRKGVFAFAMVVALITRSGISLSQVPTLPVDQRATMTQPSPPPPEIEITSASKYHIRGQLINGNTGLRFDSRKDNETASVVITTLSGEELIAVEQRSGNIVAQLDAGRLTAKVTKSELYRYKQGQRNGSLALLLQAPQEAVRTQLTAPTVLEGENDALQKVMRSPEYALLPALSWELGKLGFTGPRHPPSLALHAIGAAAGQVLHTDPRQPSMTYRWKLPRTWTRHQFSVDDWLTEMTGIGATDCWDPASGVPNLDELPTCAGQCKDHPNPSRDCYGMCGPGCDKCWSWVCGDCCFHSFCAMHDSALRACDGVTDVASCVLAFVPIWFVLIGCG